MVSGEGACAAYYQYRRLPSGPRLSVPGGGTVEPEAWSCPLPLRDHPNVVMGHGGGGRLSGDASWPTWSSRRSAGPRPRPSARPSLGDAAVPSWGRGGPAGVRRPHHRQLRRAPAVLPRRQHRRPRGQRHRQRPGHERGRAPLRVSRARSSRRACPWTSWPHRRDRWGRRPAPPGWRSSPATRRSSTAATATVCT